MSGDEHKGTEKTMSIKDILSNTSNFKTADEAISYILGLEQCYRKWEIVKHYAMPLGGSQELFPRSRYKADLEALQQALPALQKDLKAQIENLFYVPLKAAEEKVKRAQARTVELACKEQEYTTSEQQLAKKSQELEQLETKIKAEGMQVAENQRKAQQALRESDEARRYYESSKRKYDGMTAALEQKETALHQKEARLNLFYETVLNLQFSIEQFLKLQPAPKVVGGQAPGISAVDDLFSLPVEDHPELKSRDSPTLLDASPVNPKEQKPKA